MLANDDAWRRLPGAQGEAQQLPGWARVLAGILPATTARMLELDALHRTGDRLEPRLRGVVRWAAADANECEYSKSIALADLQRDGLSANEAETLLAGNENLTRSEGAAAAFARKMMCAAYTVTDDEVAELLDLIGEEPLVALVHLLAHASFQDRLFLAPRLPSEPDGPLPPLNVTFSQPDGSVRSPQSPPPVATPSSPDVKAQPTEPAPEWSKLQARLDNQRQRAARIRVPSREEMLKRIGPDHPAAWQADILWSRVSYGMQPELTDAWFGCVAAFRSEAALDRMTQQNIFWIVTQAVECFY